MQLADDVWCHVLSFAMDHPRALCAACLVCVQWNRVARGGTATWLSHFYRNPACYHLRCDEEPPLIPTRVAPSSPAVGSLRLVYDEADVQEAFLSSLHSRVTLTLSVAGLYTQAYTFQALLFFDESARTYRFGTEDGKCALLLWCTCGRMEITLNPDWLSPLLFS